MFWQEKVSTESYQIPDSVQDCVFAIEAGALPIDHLNLVANALLEYLPWLNEVGASVHDMGIASGNGWEKPQNPDALFYLSKRSKLMIRLPKEKLEAVDILVGKVLKCGQYPLRIKKRCTNKNLSDSNIIFAKYVHNGGNYLEDKFLKNIYQQLVQLHIKPPKMLAGLAHTLTTNNGTIHTRSLMLADLKKAESVYLQAKGLGQHRLLGCGLFIPQKGIDTVAPV